LANERKWHREIADEALIAAAKDEDVRLQAQRSSYARYGFEEAESATPSAYSTIPRLLLSELPTVWTEGARLLNWALLRAQHGAPLFLGTFAGNDEAMVDRFKAS
jgi:hypothetical protein